jgi:hypothetical protein
MFSMLLPLDASEARHAERPHLPPDDTHTNLLQRWLRVIRIAFALNRD